MLRKLQTLVILFLLQTAGFVYLRLEGKVFQGTSDLMAQSFPAGNRGVYFDGIDDHIKSGVINLDDFTIEFWIKTKQNGGAINYWQNGFGLVDAEDNGGPNDYGVSLGNGKIVAGIGDGNPSPEDFSIASATPVNNGAWHHVAVTRSGNVMQIFIDNILDASGSANDVIVPVGNVPLTFGSLQTNSNYFNGQLDEIKIFKRVRLNSEIGFDMESTDLLDEDLVAYWDFEESTGQGASDATGKGNNALFGGTYAAESSDPLWALRVTNISGDPTIPGTLSWAIIDANIDTEKDYIDFSIPKPNASDISTIVTTGELKVTESIFIDGYSAYGSSPNTAAFLSPNNAGPSK